MKTNNRKSTIFMAFLTIILVSLSFLLAGCEDPENEDISKPVIPTYDVIIANDLQNGTITPAPASYVEEGATVNLVVVPKSGFRYKDDSLTVTTEDGSSITVDSSENPLFTFKMPAEDVTVKANFEAPDADADKYDVIIDTTIIGGSITATPESIAAGYAVELTVEAEPGYKFVPDSLEVTKDGDPGGIIPFIGGTNKFSMPDSDVKVTATFVQTKITLSGTVTVDDEAPQSATITAYNGNRLVFFYEIQGTGDWTTNIDAFASPVNLSISVSGTYDGFPFIGDDKTVSAYNTDVPDIDFAITSFELSGTVNITIDGGEPRSAEIWLVADGDDISKKYDIDFDGSGNGTWEIKVSKYYENRSIYFYLLAYDSDGYDYTRETATTMYLSGDVEDIDLGEIEISTE